MRSLPLEVNSNNILLAFSKVQWCKLYWCNQYGQTADSNPKFPTYYKERVMPFDRPAHYNSRTSNETYEDYLKRNHALDIWSARTVFQLAANHSVYFVGKQAIKLEKAYRGWLLNKQQHKRKKKPCNQQQDLI